VWAVAYRPVCDLRRRIYMAASYHIHVLISTHTYVGETCIDVGATVLVRKFLVRAILKLRAG